MKALSYTALRSTLAKTMKKVCDGHEPIVITRKSEGAVTNLPFAYNIANHRRFTVRVKLSC
ncbi:MAG: type II toxin-antitoxin system Phd/YefM family antitoxin [Gammaproteobacteria bacterium]|nr:type II toxin-antitoxin system Phd/YefM family antitoxin [Gammaproteobacteria bacterium]